VHLKQHKLSKPGCTAHKESLVSKNYERKRKKTKRKRKKSNLLPFSDKVRISIALLDTVVIKLLANGLPLEVEVIDVPGALMVKLHDRPQGLNSTFSFMGFILSCTNIFTIIIMIMIMIMIIAIVHLKVEVH
jgi:hypothetical protein